MSSSFIRVPDDSGYSGPRIKTYTSTDGGNTVHAHAMVVVDANGNPTSPLVNGGNVNVISGNINVTSGSISISNFPSVQPISASSLPLPTGASQDFTLTSGSQKTQLANASGSPLTTRLLNDPIVGTDLAGVVQSVIHGLSSQGGGTYVDVKVAPSGAMIVDSSGSTQPISGSVSVSNFPATQPISGSVSISGSVATTGPLTDTQLRATPVPVSGTFFQATQPVSNTNLDVALSTRLKPADTLTKVATVDTITNPVAVTGTFFQATQPVSGTFFQSVQPTTASDVLTKGTQGATGFSMQALKDAGRAIKTYTANGIAGVTTEALATMTPQTDGTNGTAGTSFTVTSGKKLRLQSIVVSTRASAAALAKSTFFLRMSSSGAVTTSSAIIAIAEVTGPAATANTGSQLQTSIPDGFELSGTMQFGVSHISAATSMVENISIIGYEY